MGARGSSPHPGTEDVQWVKNMSLQWRHNGCDGVSNHQPDDCSLNRLFRRRSKKTSKLRVTCLCAGISPATGEFPAQMASNAKNVSIWWRHHVQWRQGCLPQYHKAVGMQWTRTIRRTYWTKTLCGLWWFYFLFFGYISHKQAARQAQQRSPFFIHRPVYVRWAICRCEQ